MATTGFFRKLEFDWKKAFSCPCCGNSPKFFCMDGKEDIGPLKRKVQHLEELDRHPDDHEVLEQGSHFSKRVFLSAHKERQLACGLVTGTISVKEFLQSEDIKSENGELVRDLVKKIEEENPLQIPEEYITFLSNISKPSSVPGLLQTTGPVPLSHLKHFCEKKLDLGSVSNKDKSRLLEKELPAFFPNLMKIKAKAGTQYLPDCVNTIVLKLLKIRDETFRNAPKRSDSDYFPWNGSNGHADHPTMCYPTLPLFRYPKKYRVSGVAGRNLFPTTTSATAFPPWAVVVRTT